MLIENLDGFWKPDDIRDLIQEKTKRVDIHTWNGNQDFNTFFNSTIKDNEPHVLLYMFLYKTAVVDGDIKKVEYIKQDLGENSENYILPVIICEGGELTEEKKQNLMKQVQDKLELKRFCGIGENETPEEQVNKLMEKIKEVVDGNHNEGYKWEPVRGTQPKEPGQTTDSAFKIIFH